MEVGVNKEALSTTKRRLLQQQMRGTAAQERSKPIRPRPPGTVVPLSPEQRRVWLHASQHPELPLYNESITIHRHGRLELGILEASLNEILRRHEIWRTSFSADGRPVIHDDLRVTLLFADLSGLPPAQREAEALRLAAADAQTPVPLDQPPLFRARLVRMTAAEQRLYLTLHHIIFDGVSISRVLLPELSAIYSSFEQGKASPFPAPKLQYGDYALWRELHVNSPAVQQHLAYCPSSCPANCRFCAFPSIGHSLLSPAIGVRQNASIFHLSCWRNSASCAANTALRFIWRCLPRSTCCCFDTVARTISSSAASPTDEGGRSSKP